MEIDAWLTEEVRNSEAAGRTNRESNSTATATPHAGFMVATLPGEAAKADLSAWYVPPSGPGVWLGASHRYSREEEARPPSGAKRPQYGEK